MICMKTLSKVQRGRHIYTISQETKGQRDYVITQSAHNEVDRRIFVPADLLDQLIDFRAGEILEKAIRNMVQGALNK